MYFHNFNLRLLMLHLKWWSMHAHVTFCHPIAEIKLWSPTRRDCFTMASKRYSYLHIVDDVCSICACICDLCVHAYFRVFKQWTWKKCMYAEVVHMHHLPYVNSIATMKAIYNGCHKVIKPWVTCNYTSSAASVCTCTDLYLKLHAWLHTLLV